MNNSTVAFYERPKYTGIKIGASCFEDDTWDLSPIIKISSRPHSANIVRFESILQPEIKLVVKEFLYYKLGKIKPQSVIGNRNSLSYLLRYVEMIGIKSLAELSNKSLVEFNTWLKNECHLSKRTGYMAMHVVEEIIEIGAVKGWKVPDVSILNGVYSSEIWGSGKDKSSENRFKPIPDEIFDKIVSCAITYEKNLLTKAGILIQSQTGLRIGEVLSLKTGCLHKELGKSPYFDVYISKTSKEKPILHKVYANSIVVMAIEELEEGTRDLRKESGKQELFLRRGRGVGVPYATSWSKTYLRTFIKNCDIRDSNGELYPLKSHQFRATFVKKLVLKGIPLAFAMKQFAHVSIEMTSHYLMLQEAEIKVLYSDILLSPENKLVGINADNITDAKDEYFKGKTKEEYGSCIEELAEGLTFNPLPSGICLYDYRRGNCSDGEGCLFYNCPNFVTEKSFLPVLERELKLLVEAMQREHDAGHEREWQRMNSKYQYLEPMVKELRG